MRLPGRRRQLELIGDALSTAAEGRGCLLVVNGPGGAGRTAMADAACTEARKRGFAVLRAAAVATRSGRLLWAQLLRDVGETDAAAAVMNARTPLDLDAVAALSGGGRRLIVVDDIDLGGAEAIDVLAVLSSRLAGSATVVLATSMAPLGFGADIALPLLSEADVRQLVPGVGPDAVRALRVAGRGLPGPILALARHVERSDDDPLVALALAAESRAEFLEVDADLVALLESALERAHEATPRARLLARSAHASMGDASSAPRRRARADEALQLARDSGDDAVLAEVLDARLHALWDPDGAGDRLVTAAEIVDLARRVGDSERERSGLFWRFVALMEFARVAEAEFALAQYERAAQDAGDAPGQHMALARHAMLAAMRGRFDEARDRIAEVVAIGERLGLVESARLATALRGAIAMEREIAEPGLGVAGDVLTYARRFPGHFFDATAARVRAMTGDEHGAVAELDRALAPTLAGAGPRWVGAIADLAFVAARTHQTAAAKQLYAALLPYRGRLVVWAGANTVTGPVDHYLGLLAVETERPDEALELLDAAVSTQDSYGALPGLARSLAARADAHTMHGDSGPARADRARAEAIAARVDIKLPAPCRTPADEWSLLRDGDDWLLAAGRERARLRDSRGLHYLSALLAFPGRDIAALDLVAGGTGNTVPAAPRGMGTMIDPAARAAYRRRLEQLSAELDAADAAGDSARAARAGTERDGLLAELRRATGLGGRLRETSTEAERARVNVTRTLRATIERISAYAPACASHLGASVRTGRLCRYELGPGGPQRWRV